MKSRIEVEGVHRNFHTGQLSVWGRKIPALYTESEGKFYANLESSVQFTRLIHEPISDEDRAMIGDLPIPLVLAKVDL